jgi:hypothetical protein
MLGMDIISAASNWSAIEVHLPREWREIAAQHGMAQPNVPAQLGAKITDISVPLRMLLYRVGTNSSLKVAAAAAFAGEVADISPVAFHLWERKMGPFVADLVASLAETESQFSAERWAGYDIVIVDASAVCRPGAEGTTGRVHYALRLTSLQAVDVQVTDDKGGETFRRFHPEAGQLWIGDRGYSNPPGIAFVKAEGAEVLVRYNRGSLPLYDVWGQRLDVQAKLAKLAKAGRVREWAAWVHAQGAERICGRLIAVRLPPDKAQEARERLRREQGSQVTAESLAMADFVVVFTTVSKDKLHAERVLELYRLRWQVELHIKRDKSIAGLDRLPNRRPDTVYTWICAKMLLVQIARRMTCANDAIPPSGFCGQLLEQDGRQGSWIERPTTSRTQPHRRERRQRALACDDPGLASGLCSTPAC